MSTRFGGATTSSSNEMQKKFLQAIIVVVVLLLVYLIIKAMGGQEQPVPVPVTQAPVPVVEEPVIVPTVVDIAVARKRIEEGVQITEDMIGTKAVGVDNAPGDIIEYENRFTDLVGRWSNRLITAGQPIFGSSISQSRPLTEINIPPGYRAIAITIDKRSGVDSWARPNSRVDVLWTFVDSKDRRKKVHTLLRFVKILSVGGSTRADDAPGIDDRGTNVTLLVTEEDARKVELARTLGTLSLTLVGDKQNPALNEPSQGQTVTIDDILGNSRNKQDFAEFQETYEGETYFQDESGRRVRMVLVNGRWKKAQD